MDLVEAIYKMTLDLKHTYEEEKYEKIEQLLNDRNNLMQKLDELRAENDFHHYSAKEKQLLEETFHLNQSLIPLVNEKMEEIKTILNQMKMNKQVSKKYQPYMKQTNGAFIDSKK